MGNCTPPPPQIKDRKMARFGFILDFAGGGGGGGLLFHFILSKIATDSYKLERGGDFIFSD